jgi:response regulator RpfG family c-di-GMP phosphodiesterase
MDDNNKNSVLAIDDEPQHLKLLNNILKEDYTCYLANDGKSGIEMAVKHKPDVILLDVMMPEMNGYEVLMSIKAIPEIKDIPVMLVTGVDAVDFVKGKEYELSLYVAEYVAKPFVAEKVKTKIKKLLQEK